MRDPMTPFAALLVDTMRSCEGRSASALHGVLTAKVRAWAEEQQALSPAMFDYVPSPAEPFSSIQGAV